MLMDQFVYILNWHSDVVIGRQVYLAIAYPGHTYSYLDDS